MERLIRPIVRVGNSAGVLLPREWLNGEARVELISKPLNLKKDILEILEDYLDDIKGIYLTGSYAREEGEKGSDIDVLVITGDINKKIRKGRYELLLISEKELGKSLKRNILPILPMIREAKPILNGMLIEKYKKIKPNKENTKFILSITESSRKMSRIFIELARESNEKISDGIMYSLILGLRTIYILGSLRRNITPTTKGLKKLVKRLTNSEESYLAYLRSKRNGSEKEIISPDTAEKINNYIKLKLSEYKNGK